jgi:hypothetical protein
MYGNIVQIFACSRVEYPFKVSSRLALKNGSNDFSSVSIESLSAPMAEVGVSIPGGCGQEQNLDPACRSGTSLFL